MASWPGWNSVESTGAWSNFYFWLGIFALVLLGACELVSHRYSLRKDELVASAQEQLATRLALSSRQAQATTAQLRQEQAKTAAAEPAAQPGTGEQLLGQRHLTEAEKRELLDAIAAFDGEPITITSLQGDREAQVYRDDFAEIFKEARWATDGHVGEMGLDAGYVGVAVAMDKGWVDAGHKLPNAAVALISILAKLNIMPAKNVTLIGNLPPGRIILVVGTKPPA